MKVKKSFVLYTDLEERLSNLSHEELGKIFKAILHYSNTKEVINLSEKLIYVFDFIKKDIDDNDKKYQAKVDRLEENAKKGKSKRNRTISDDIGSDSESITNTITNIITYLNNLLNTKYKTSTKKTVTLITARLKEKYTEEDFKKVIDKKYNEWKDTEFEQYLTPETLFGNKFEKYLNQKEKDKKEPEWFNKEIKAEKATEEEKAELEKYLKEFR